jgi:hypothetical protein
MLRKSVQWDHTYAMRTDGETDMKTIVFRNSSAKAPKRHREYKAYTYTGLCSEVQCFHL